MILPAQCSAKFDGKECQLGPSYVISVKSHEDEYLLAVVCADHKSAIEARLISMQDAKKIPRGRIHFDPIKAVVTDCAMRYNEEYIELNEGSPD